MEEVEKFIFNCEHYINNRMEEINEIIRKTERDIRENENTQKILNIIETRKRHGRRHGRRQRKNK